jgi:ABC-type transport system involved in cytochrome bd biosynthesis fused ATPase/permease subunit
VVVPANAVGSPFLDRKIGTFGTLMGWMAQRAHLLNTTIRENVALAGLSRSTQRSWR